MLPPPPRPASSGMAPDEQTSSAWTSSGTAQKHEERRELGQVDLDIDVV